jgi:hypothetical protein
MTNVACGAQGGVLFENAGLGYQSEIPQRVEGRAATKNYCLRVSSKDIRAMGLIMFIQAMRDGGVRWQQYPVPLPG